MTIKVGDKVKFTESCTFTGFHEAGITGVVTSIKPELHYGYLVKIDVQRLIDSGLVTTDDGTNWPMKLEEIEKVQ